MDDSIAHPSCAPAWALSGWKTAASHTAAVLVGCLFVIAGVWKITDPFAAAVRFEQALVPHAISLIGACGLGSGELFAGVLVIVPRFRRWGAWLLGAMLVFFLIYIGANYAALHGEECNCFPWVKRAVGPAFFIGDLIMLAAAALAGWWARPSHGLRTASLMLVAVVVFAAVSLGVSYRIDAAIEAPPLIQVEGKQFALRDGRVVLFFYNPECLHCDAAARSMAAFRWKNGVRLVSIATEQPQFAKEFLQSTGLRAAVSSDTQTLRKAFTFTSTPYLVALDNGRAKATLTNFDPPGFEETLRRAGFTH